MAMLSRKVFGGAPLPRRTVSASSMNVAFADLCAMVKRKLMCIWELAAPESEDAADLDDLKILNALRGNAARPEPIYDGVSVERQKLLILWMNVALLVDPLLETLADWLSLNTSDFGINLSGGIDS